MLHVFFKKALTNYCLLESGGGGGGGGLFAHPNSNVQNKIRI